MGPLHAGRSPADHQHRILGVLIDHEECVEVRDLLVGADGGVFVFGEPFGSLDAGAPADFILLDNFQKTPLTTDTWLGHLLFDFHPWDIHAVYAGGRRVYLNGDSPPIDAERLQKTAARLWKNMGLIS